MSAPLLLLLWGLVSAAAVAVSLWPPYRPGSVAVLVWPVGWLIGELPLHHLAVQCGAGAALVAAGALAEPAGWIGLAGWLGAIAGLRQHLVYAARVPAAVDRGLRGVLGEATPPPAPARSRAREASPSRIPIDRSAPPKTARPTCDQTRGLPSLGRQWLSLAAVFPFRPRHVKRIRDVVYAPRLALDIYTCDQHCGTMPRPVFVYVHGGAWVIGNKGQQGRLTVHELAAAGWVCVSLNYRLSPRATFPDHLIDVKRALAWVKAHIAEHGGDPSFVVIGGGSAGAHLASLAALTAGRPEYQPGFEDVDLTVQGCVAYYGVFDFVDRERHFRHRAFHDLLLARIVMKAKLAAAAAAYEAASPTLQVCANAPPFLVFHGDRDSLAPVSAARAFVGALRGACGSPIVYVELPGAQHAFELFPSLRSLAVVDGTRRFCQAIWDAARRAHAHTPADAR